MPKNPVEINATPGLSQVKEELASSNAKPQFLLLLPPNVNIGNNVVLLPQPQKPASKIAKPCFQSVKGYVSDPRGQGAPVCRTCFRAIFNQRFIKLYDDKNKENCDKLRRMLKEVNPFVDLELYLNPVMCTKCVQMLFDSYAFRTKCLDAEQRINGWVSRRQNVKNTEVNLLVKVESSTEGDETEELEKHTTVSTVKNQQLQTDINLSENFVALDHDYLGAVPKLVVVPNVKKKFMYKPLVSSNTILKSKIIKRGFLCDKCGQLAKNHHPSLHAHCTDGAVYKCRHCDYMVRSLSVLEKHLETHTIHHCGQCNKNFSSLKLMRSHIKTTHLRKQTFSCHVCGKTFNHRCSLYKHLVYHNPDKIPRLTCEKCSKTFKYEKNYIRHLRLHNGPTFTCSFCGKRISREDRLKNHIQMVHGTKSNIRNEKDQNDYKCPICGLRFPTEFEHTKHLKIHDMQPFMCEICGKTSKDLRTLKMHLQLYHDDKGTYKCEKCSRGFWKQEYLVQHMSKVHPIRPGVEKEEGKEEPKFGFEEEPVHVDKNKENVVVQRMEV